MFIVFLKFGENKGKADQFMQGHMDWVKRGLRDGVFLLVGSLVPGIGGGILAHNTSMANLKKRVQKDPFVAEGIVVPEIFEFEPSSAASRLQFLVESD